MEMKSDTSNSSLLKLYWKSILHLLKYFEMEDKYYLYFQNT